MLSFVLSLKKVDSETDRIKRLTSFSREIHKCQAIVIDTGLVSYFNTLPNPSNSYVINIKHVEI